MSDEKIVSLELERVARLPMLDTNLKDVQDLVEAFVNQLVHLGHREGAGFFGVGTLTAEISVKVYQPEPKP